MTYTDKMTANGGDNPESTSNENPSRRSVLKGIAKSTALVPFAAAAPAMAVAGVSIEEGLLPSRSILLAYNNWLYNERRVLAAEMYGLDHDADRVIPVSTGVDLFHSRNWAILDERFGFEVRQRPWTNRHTNVMPSQRAEPTLRSVGADLLKVVKREPHN